MNANFLLRSKAADRIAWVEAAANFSSCKKVNRRARDVINEIAIAAQRRPFAGPATPGNHCNRDSFVKRIWKENLGWTAEGRREEGRCPIVTRRSR